MVCLMCSNVLASFKTSQQFISITSHGAWQVESPPKAPQSCRGKNFVLQNFFFWNLLTLQGFRGTLSVVALLAPKFCKQKALLLPKIYCLIGSFSYSYFFIFYRNRCFADTLTLKKIIALVQGNGSAPQRKLDKRGHFQPQKV